MRRSLITPLALFAMLVAACGSSTGNTAAADLEPTTDQRAAVVADAPITTLADGFNNAGFDILRSQSTDGNAVLSPVSIGHALLMARAAADDATGNSIDDALSLPDGLAAHDAWNAIDQMVAAANGTTTGLDQAPSPVISIADRIWPAAGVTPDQEWVDLLATHHGSDVSTIDVSQPEVSRAEVNQWVADATEQLIPELLPPGFITGDTTLVLTDAIYFKAQWETIFGKYGETQADFHLLAGTIKSTTFMRDLEGQGARGVGDGWAAAVLPYRGGDFSMMLIVPEDGRFEEVRTNLNATFLSEIDSSIAPGPYELLMPKWENTTNIDLLPWLTDIGAAPGNYPAITPGSFLSGGVHAADIAVDEIGTVAAAATGLGFAESGPPEPEITISADRPFFYVIRHHDSGLVLFAGHVVDPNA